MTAALQLYAAYVQEASTQVLLPSAVPQETVALTPRELKPFGGRWKAKRRGRSGAFLGSPKTPLRVTPTVRRASWIARANSLRW